jgi:hypothetical protein
MQVYLLIPYWVLEGIIVVSSMHLLVVSVYRYSRRQLARLEEPFLVFFAVMFLVMPFVLFQILLCVRDEQQIKVGFHVLAVVVFVLNRIVSHRVLSRLLGVRDEQQIKFINYVLATSSYTCICRINRILSDVCAMGSRSRTLLILHCYSYRLPIYTLYICITAAPAQAQRDERGHPFLIFFSIYLCLTSHSYSQHQHKLSAMSTASPLLAFIGWNCVVSFYFGALITIIACDSWLVCRVDVLRCLCRLT